MPQANVGLSPEDLSQTDSPALHIPRLGGSLVCVSHQNNFLNQSGNINSTVIMSGASGPGGFAGLFRVSGYVKISTPATVGVMDVLLSWNDAVAQSRAVISALSMIVGGVYSDFSAIVRIVAGEDIGISTVIAGLVGTPSYSLYTRIEPLQIN